MFDVCRKTVTILEAIAYGREGACLDLGTGSLAAAVVAFVVAVVALKVLGKLLLSALFAGLRRALARRGDAVRPVDDGPIRSIRPR